MTDALTRRRLIHTRMPYRIATLFVTQRFRDFEPSRTDGYADVCLRDGTKGKFWGRIPLTSSCDQSGVPISYGA